jgi:hypothetical protein
MNEHQRRKLVQLKDELRVQRGTLPIRGGSRGYVFTEVDGVARQIVKHLWIICALIPAIWANPLLHFQVGFFR